MIEIITTFLSLLQISFNKQTVRNFLNTHPYHPSIISISDLLDEFNIENAAVKIGKPNFSQIPTPFIAKTSSSDGDYCLITILNENDITYLNEKGKWVNTKPEYFFLQYSGVVLVAEKSKKSGEPFYFENKCKYLLKNILYLFTAILFTAISLTSLINYITQAQTIPVALLFVLNILGIGVCILLLIQSFNVNNPFINKLCSSGSGNGCNSILSSPVAKIFNGAISWSEVGFFYFFASFIVLCFWTGSEKINFLTIINIAALPYTVYSIGFQFIKKTWCRLCLTIQIILWLQFFSLIPFFTLPFNVLDYKMVFLFYSVTLTASINLWILIKPLISNKQKIAVLERDVNLFKKDETIFYSLLEQQRKVEAIDLTNKIIFGNPNAKFEITFVSNPYCVPCSEMHKLLQQLLEDCRDDLALNVVYAGSFTIGDKKNSIIQTFIAIYQQQGRIVCEQAMKEWYEQGINFPKSWMEKYGHYDKNNEEIYRIFDAHRSWCDENEITHTPMLFINNYQYLSEYNLNDLKHFIHLAAKQQNVSTVSHI